MVLLISRFREHIGSLLHIRKPLQKVSAKGLDFYADAPKSSKANPLGDFTPHRVRAIMVKQQDSRFLPADLKTKD